MSTIVSQSRPVGNMRQSNMESLRIIAMSMILIHHFMVHGLKQPNIPHHLFNALNGFVYSGVNIFFILSGYFTIRYSSKGLLKLLFTILFFGIVNLVLLSMVGLQPGIKDWIEVITFPVTKSYYWFMKVYLFLYITAPILNAGLKHIERPALRNTLIVLIIVAFYSRTYETINSYLLGFYLYCVGYYIGRYKPLIHVRRGWWLLGAFLSAAISGVLDWSLAEHGIDIDTFRSYGNVFIFVCAVMLVLFFREFSFRNRTINSIASASLGCYLLQDGDFGHNWIYDYQQLMLSQYGYSTRLFIIFGSFFIAFWILSWLITKFLGLWLPQFSGFLDRMLHSAVRYIPRIGKGAYSPE